MSIRALVVDDQALIRAGFRMILEAQPDITVAAEAGDGATAIELARVHRPDIVLMDVRMPGLDGIAATRAVVTERPATRVLILTTFDLDSYVYDALRAGASGFLLKDVGREELIAAVRGGRGRRAHRPGDHPTPAGRFRAGPPAHTGRTGRRLRR